MEKTIKSNEVARLLELRREILKHDKLYNAEKAEITDTEYDNLYLELVELEDKYPEFFDENSPTQVVTSEDLIKDGEKVKHTVPMLSQEKAKTEEAIRKFCKKADISKGIIVSWKLDGLTVVTRFKDGVPYLFATRGNDNGITGEVVTESCRKCFNEKVEYNYDFETRGEAVIPFEDFKRVNLDGKYKSPRNLVSGSVRALDSDIAKDRGMKIITFDTIYVDGKDFDLDTERFEWLNSLGIETVPYEVFYDVDSIVDYCLAFNKEHRPNSPIQLDGLILSYNDLSIRKKLGFTAKYPKWSIAFKFESQDAITILTDVVWQIGKTGIIAPVGIFEPVDIDGATIRRASLANLTNVQARNLKIGDKILVQKANDVIPQIVSSYPEERDGTEIEITMPKTCPCCDHETVYDGTYVMCENPNCSEQLERKLQHFVSVNAMNIDGLGKKTVSFLLEGGYISSISDIFRFKEQQTLLEEIKLKIGIETISNFINLEEEDYKDFKERMDNLKVEDLDYPEEKMKIIRNVFPNTGDINRELIESAKGFGKRKIEKMYNGIEECKNKPLNNVLYSLSIPNLGQTVSKVIANKYKSIDVLLEKAKNPDSFKEELLSIPDFGEAISSSIVHFFSNEEPFLRELQSLGVKMEMEVVDVQTNESITGKSFVVTGSVEHFKNRKELAAKIEELGGKVVGSVSKKTDYLINNDTESISGKNKKAKELNIPILSEEDFLNLI